MRLFAVPAALFCLAIAADVAHPDACDGFPPPTNFTVVVGPTPDQSSTGVDVRWTPAATSFAGSTFNANTMFQRYDVQRRDDTAHGDFVSLSEGNANVQTTTFGGMRTRTTNFYFNLVEKPEVQPCVSPWGPCAKLGRTYTYRVITKFRYLPDCPLYDGGRDYDSAPTPEVTVTMPGTLVSDDPVARDVRAIADPKKPRVTITWKPPEEEVDFDGYVVLRRTKSAGPSAKAEEAEADFVEIAALSASASKFIDTSVDPETDNEYAVAIKVDGLLAEQRAKDSAFTQPGRCPSSQFRIWDKMWTFDKGAMVGEWTSKSLQPNLRDYNCFPPSPCVAGDTYHAAFVGPLRLGARLKAKFTGVALAGHGFLEIDGEPVPSNTRGTLTLTLSKDKHFDAFAEDAYKKATIDVAFGKFKHHAEMLRDPDSASSTALCGVLAAGKLKGQTVAPGRIVYFAFRVGALGPQPLYAKELQVHFDVAGGTFADLIPDAAARLRDEGLTPTHAEFDIAALGPDSKGKTEIAEILVAAVAPVRPANGQLRVTARFVDLKAGQSLTLPAVSPYAEVLIDGAPIAKDD